MSGTIWSKFYWSDWETDPGLKLCSLAAQGLWMRMLCIAAASDGYVVVAGNGLTDEQVAQAAGRTLDECAPLLAELARFGVFSRTRSGIIYCRRMVKQAQKSKTARENGKNGGNPSLTKQKEIFSLVNQTINQIPTNDLPPMEEHHKPDTKSHISSDDDIEFDMFAAEPLPVVATPKPKTRGDTATSWDVRKTPELPDEWRLESAKLGMTHREAEDQFNRFSDFWASKGGQNGRKKDWTATWRNWCRSFLDRAGRGASAPASRSEQRTQSMLAGAQIALNRHRG